MNLLEKITLYDILGYTLPGCVLLYILQYPDKLVEKNCTTFEMICFIASGFLMGIILSEIAELLTARYTSHPRTKRKMEEKLEVKPSKIRQALRTAKILPRSEQIPDNELAEKYFTNMFSDIQADKQYSRIHNYASAELLYKNMALVCAVCSPIFGSRQYCMAMWFSITATLIFLNRWRRFHERKILYTIYWYVHKYTSQK